MRMSPTRMMAAIGALAAAQTAMAAHPAIRLGTPYPGSTITEPQRPRNCGTHFKFSTRAGLDQVARFYLAEGQGDHLPLLSDTGGKFPGYRMIVFSGGRTGRLLSVVLDARQGEVHGTVYYVLSRPAGCDTRG